MSVYKIRSDKENYKSFDLDLEELFEKLGEDFDFNFPSLGVSVKKQWKKLTSGEFVQPAEFPEANAMPDITDWQTGDLVLSEKAYKLLNKVLIEYGEFLPVASDGENYYIFNVLNTLDVVDEENSEKDLDQGILMRIKKLKFKNSMLDETLLFKVEYDELSSVYCTDKFKRLVEQSGLTGLDFTTDMVS